MTEKPEPSETLESFDPATGQVVGSVAVTPAEGITEIVGRAREAAPSWAGLNASQRGQALLQAAAQLADRAEELGQDLSREMGKPLARGIGEVRGCGRSMAFKVEHAIAALEPVITRARGVETTLHYDPLGVCAVISPWNYPMAMPHWMIVPALMAGNAVVFKPSEETPLAGQAYADVLNEFLPAGVLQVVHGADDQGKALVASDVDMVTFTGSRAVGMNIMRSAAGGLKRLVLELGGKDPLIVLGDADLDAAAQFAVANSFDNSGQACISTERIFVDESVAEGFEARVAELAAQVRWGPWDEEEVEVGPMIHAEQRRHVLDQIEEAVAKGARVLVGEGEHPERYVLPTVLAGVTDGMTIARDETFGPVACISTYGTVDEAVERANAGPYGLGAVVFGADEERAYEVARRLEAGMIGVNRGIHGVGDTPWVGAKQSGFGYHGSPDGYRQFAQVRVVSRQI